MTVEQKQAGRKGCSGPRDRGAARLGGQATGLRVMWALRPSCCPRDPVTGNLEGAEQEGTCQRRGPARGLSRNLCWWRCDRATWDLSMLPAGLRPVHPRYTGGIPSFAGNVWEWAGSPARGRFRALRCICVSSARKLDLDGRKDRTEMANLARYTLLK